MILKSDDVPLIRALVTAVQKKWAVDNQNFHAQLVPCTSPADDLASNRAAETLLAKEPGAQEGKRFSTWDIGIWLELSTRTSEHLVGTRTGVTRARPVKRRPEPLKWDGELSLVAWLIDGPVARPEAGWTPTPGCKTCDEGGSGMKRRGRPSDNNPECALRQAVFRERPCEVEIVSADGAPPLMELVDCPVLSRSSIGVDAQQPVGVDPDPMVRRSLKRASKGDSGIADIYLFADLRWQCE